MKAGECQLADAVVDTLKGEGVDIVFGICGGYFFSLLSALDRAEVRTVPSRHEGAAAFAAAGYQQSSGRLGVVFGQGPGATNALTGVACAYVDSTPLLMLAGQAPQALYCADAHQGSTGSNYGVEQFPIFKAATLESFRPPTALSALRSLRRAIAIAETERGPTMLEIPANLFSDKIEFENLGPEAYRAVPHRADVASLAQVRDLVANASRPLLIIGNRACHRGLAEDLRELVEAANVPFATVDYAKGIIPEDHPLSLGIIGWCGQEGTSAYQQSADLVVTIGVRLDSKATVNFRADLFENLVQIDELPREIGRNFPLRLGICGDIPATVEALRDIFVANPVADRGAAQWVAANREEHHTYNEALATQVPKDHLMSPNAMHVLRRCLPRETLFVGDSGLNLHYLKRYMPAYAPDGFFCLYGWAAMGGGLPTAIGVQLGRPDDLVVLVIGDGGFLVHVGELQIMAEYGIPVLCIVLNNASYGQVGKYMERYMDSKYGCDIKEIDAAKIAISFGCDGYQARTETELEAAVKEALANRRPAVIDVKVKGDKIEDVMAPGVDALIRKVYAPKNQT